MKIVPSASRLVNFCLGFSLRIRRVMNFKRWEGGRVSRERGFPSLVLSVRLWCSPRAPELEEFFSF